jgi:L-ribulose-5-phosphate 3-epimerase
MRKAEHINVGIYEKALPLSMSWSERLTAAGRAGYNFVELSIDVSDERLARLEWNATQRAALRQAMVDSGVPVISMCLSAHRKYPMGSPTEEIRLRGLDIMEKAVEFAQDVGLRIVLVPGYEVFYEPGSAETKARFTEALHYAVELAGNAGIMLALENPERSVTSITQAMEYIRVINSPWLQLYGDVGNLAAHGYDVLAELEVGRGHLAGIHIKDARIDEFRNVPFGEGNVPFEAVFRKLEEINFNGPLMLEQWYEGQGNCVEALTAARRWVLERLEMSQQPIPSD